MSTHLQTYEMVGIKEDVADVISMITPTETPFLSSIKTKKVHNTLYEWQEDSLRAVTDNAKLEGFTASDENLDPTVMRNNYTQILAKVFRVSGTADAVSTYGRGKDSAREMAKAGKEVKRDLENALVGTAQTAVAGVANTTARKFAGVQAQIHADVTDDNGAVPRALTEALVEGVHELLYNEGADATILMIKPSDSKIVAGFAAAAGRERDFGHSKKITNAVNLLVTPFGEMKVVMNRFIKTTDALLYDPSNWSLAVLRPWFRETLAKDGDSLRQMILGEYGLCHSNQKASGLITDLS